MRIDPIALSNHLSRIYIPGPYGIRDAVFRGQWECVARSRDQSIVAAAPPLAGAEPLPEPLCVSNLRLLIRALQAAPGADSGDEVEIEVADGRLVVRPTVDASGYALRLLLVAEAQFIDSQIEERTVAELFEQLPEAEGTPFKSLPWDERVKEAFEDYDEAEVTDHASTVVEKMAKLLQAKRVVLHLGPDEGWWQVLSEPKPDSKSRTADVVEIFHHFRSEKPYRLTFDGGPLLSLTRLLNKVPDPHIFLHGPRSLVMFSDADGYRWLLSPTESRRAIR